MDVAVLHHHTRGWDVIAKLDVHTTKDAGKERFIEHHPQQVGAEVLIALDSAGCFSHMSFLPLPGFINIITHGGAYYTKLND